MVRQIRSLINCIMVQLEEYLFKVLVILELLKLELDFVFKMLRFMMVLMKWYFI